MVVVQASIGDCVRKGIEDLSKRLQTPLDTHSEKTLIADMWDLDTDLHTLRRVVEGMRTVSCGYTFI